MAQSPQEREMRNKSKPTDLEAFLAERDTTAPISSKTLLADLAETVRELQALAGSSPEVNGALRSILLQPVRQLAEDLAGIERMGRRERGETVPYRVLGQLQRWLISPNAGRRPRTKSRRIAGWAGRAKEHLYELPRPIAGRDFVIWNEERGRVQFRAWGRRFYEPKPGAAEPAPEAVVEALRALAVPRRAIETARVRLFLGYGQKRTEQPWIRLGAKTAWLTTAGGAKAANLDRVLPQSYVAATLPILGPKFGVRVEDDGEDCLRVTWAGAALIHETIRIADWIGSTAP